MAETDKISVVLSADTVETIRSAVDSGEYASESDVIQEALHAWKQEREMNSLDVQKLRELVQEGIESGPGVDADIVFSQLKEKYQAMLTFPSISDSNRH